MVSIKVWKKSKFINCFDKKPHQGKITGLIFIDEKKSKNHIWNSLSDPEQFAYCEFLLYNYVI